MEKLQDAKSKVRLEIRDLKDRLKAAQENLVMLREKIQSADLLLDETN